MTSQERVMVTGGAGFVGSTLVDELLHRGYQVLCFDDFNNFYDPTMKRSNIAQHLLADDYTLVEGDVTDEELVWQTVTNWRPEVIVHLAARAGVRPSLDHPRVYQATNVAGTLNMLEAAKDVGIRKFVFGSSSSVYGLNSNVPFSETDALLRPASPYAATKIAGEALCHTYAHLYGVPTVSLRFFTAYGPRQRPDRAIRKFAEQMLSGRRVTLFGDGSSSRDYTYVDDIIRGVLAAMDCDDPSYDVFNLGNSSPTKLIDLVHKLEEVLGVEADINWEDDRAGDVPITFADISKAGTLLGYSPRISLDEGLERFARWLRKKVSPSSTRIAVVRPRRTQSGLVWGCRRTPYRGPETRGVGGQGGC